MSSVAVSSFPSPCANPVTIPEGPESDSEHVDMAAMVPPEPNNALLGIMAWHVFTKGNPCDYSAVHHQMFQWVMGDCGKNLHKIPWGKENFLRGLFTPVSAVPPMKLKINGEPYKGEVEKYNDRVNKTDLLNQVLNAGQPIYEFPTAKKAAYDPNNPDYDPYAYLSDLKDFSHLFKPLEERNGLHPRLTWGFNTRFKRNMVVISRWE